MKKRENKNNIRNQKDFNKYNSKVVINNSADLYKLPINTIKNSNLNDFQGGYFDEIYQEALKIERREAMKNLNEAKNNIV